MKMRRLLPLVALSLALSGCGFGSYFSSSESGKSGKANATFNREITDDGVGVVTAQTRFDQETLTELFGKEYRLRKGMGMKNDQLFSFYEVLRTVDGNEQLLMVIYGDQMKAIERIVVQDNLMNSSGAHIGTPFNELYSQAFGMCHRAEGEDLGSLICWAPNSEHISYIFSGEMDQSDTLLPADDLLANWTLTKIIWESEAR